MTVPHDGPLTGLLPQPVIDIFPGRTAMRAAGDRRTFACGGIPTPASRAARLRPGRLMLKHVGSPLDARDVLSVERQAPLLRAVIAKLENAAEDDPAFPMTYTTASFACIDDIDASIAQLDEEIGGPLSE